MGFLPPVRLALVHAVGALALPRRVRSFLSEPEADARHRAGIETSVPAIATPDGP
ncbi:MAG: hypothetical protein AVDCRST_MAG73-3736 [uncultured Thermomicrobiales bacterium]|uniref:Uncharacterized protein n=1 Tax=uncultured Thermomicrobiales bacterium TaxID=1645740 RepID=A0A6J4UXK2_9BACT|nr:MAG: hypothetical protein AVDCRST_MAG73-3736 [uncultured Thermomicrobiales bacterium]